MDLGRAKRIDGVQDRYIEFAKRTLPRNLSLRGCALWSIAPMARATGSLREALRELDAEVIAMGVEPDGFNINRECGSTEPAASCQKVKEMRADIGIALDGDADRVLIADERGRVVDGDQLLAVIAESWKADGRLAVSGDRRNRNVQFRGSSAISRNRQSRSCALPVGDRYVLEHAQPRLQRGRGSLRPHHHVRLHHHRRWLAGGAAGVGGW